MADDRSLSIGGSEIPETKRSPMRSLSMIQEQQTNEDNDEDSLTGRQIQEELGAEFDSEEEIIDTDSLEPLETEMDISSEDIWSKRGVQTKAQELGELKSEDEEVKPAQNSFFNDEKIEPIPNEKTYIRRDDRSKILKEVLSSESNPFASITWENIREIIHDFTLSLEYFTPTTISFHTNGLINQGWIHDCALCIDPIEDLLNKRRLGRELALVGSVISMDEAVAILKERTILEILEQKDEVAYAQFDYLLSTASNAILIPGTCGYRSGRDYIKRVFGMILQHHYICVQTLTRRIFRHGGNNLASFGLELGGAPIEC